MKKNILVSVDRGETRVAVLEAKGSPKAGKRPKKATPSNEWKVAELYVERRGRRSIVGNIYKGKVDNVLPGMEAAFVDIGLERNGFLHVDEIVLPGRPGRPQAGPRPGPPHRRADQARAGDHRPGRQGPAEDEGRAALDAALDRRPLPRLHAAGRRHRRLQAPPRRRARPAAQADREGGHRQGRRDRPHRRAGRQEGGLRARDRLPAPAQRGRGSERAEKSEVGQMVFQEADLSIRVVRDVLGRGVRGRDHRRRQAARPGHELPAAHRARSSSIGSSSTRARSLCSRSGTWSPRSTRCSAAASTCPPAAT